MRASKEARTRQRWREHAARLVVEACFTVESARRSDGRWWARATAGAISFVDAGEEREDVIAKVLTFARGSVQMGSPFDVALTRSYAERLIAEGERLEAERFIFAEWTRTQGREGITTPLGMGPECRDPHAFKPPAAWASGGKQCKCAGWAREIGQNERDFAAGRVAFLRHAKGCEHANVVGGWPGPLAREWGWEKCKACANKMLWHEARCIKRERTKDIAVAHFEGEGWTVTVHEEPWSWRLTCSRPAHQGPNSLYRRWNCKACGNRRRVRRHGREAAAANGGAWMIRAGRRLLDTLDGRCPWAPSAAAQPSECRNPTPAWGAGNRTGLCKGGYLRYGAEVDPVCIDCRGTGHNLSGTLPPVEVSPQRRRWLSDAYTHSAGPESLDTRQGQALVALESESHEWDLFATPQRETPWCEEPRVVPRGQHMALDSFDIVHALHRAFGRTRYDQHGRDRRSASSGEARQLWVPWSTDTRDGVHVYEPPLPDGHHGPCQRIVTPRNLLPRWRRGELRHSEQRRERERRRAGAEVDRFRETNARLRDLVESARPIGTVRDVLDDGTVVVDLSDSL